MKYGSILLAGSVLLISSCGGNSSKETTAETAVTATETEAPAIFLEGMYATSTRVPQRDFNLQNIFDGKAETYWSTAQGAGPDEGFVLYFPEKLSITDLQLTQYAGAGFAVIKNVIVYADGQRLGDFDPANAIPVNSELTSLFIKIGDTDKTTRSAIASEEEESETSLETFDRNAYVGFSAIRLSNASGELKLSPPVAVQGTVTASSVLQPATAYGADQLFDSRKEFVWAEGGKGSGENEKLTFAFDDSQTITALKIWNGYQRSQKHFESNARVKTFELGLKNGAKTKYTANDSMEPQSISLSEPLNGEELELTVLEVYPGTKYKDLVISELLFFNASRPITIKNDNTDKIVTSFITETKGSILEVYIDKRLHNETVYPSYTTNRSLILRSNKTFVVYDHTYSSDGTTEESKEVVADGNWEVIEQQDDYAKIRVFGKLFNLSETIEFYKGNTSTEYIKIFQDNLEVTPGEIKGEKFIDVFYNQLPDAG